MNKIVQNHSDAETILVVDDDACIRNMLKDLLGYKGYNVITANDGEEAVEAYKVNMHNICLVLMDIVMPRIDGVKASAMIMEQNSDALILFMSGYVPDAGSGINNRRLIMKPFSVTKVIKTIRDTLDGHC
jgi:CheY-like chemotaxis protein